MRLAAASSRRALLNVARCDAHSALGTARVARARRRVQTAALSSIDVRDYPPERIRSVSIIAHIDHGKSTLADRMLEITGTIQAGSNQQVLDTLAVERERGITVRAASVSMRYEHDGEAYLINLLDTPGHADFASEVIRSLHACQGAVLLVDASQGIQAQTLSVFNAAKSQAGVQAIVGVANKIDLPHADLPATIAEIEGLVGKDAGPVVCVSAKSGQGVDGVLRRIVESVPPPNGSPDRPLRALVYDSYFDQFRGVVSFVVVIDGAIRKGDKIQFLSLGPRRFEVTDVGILHPGEVSSPHGLLTGQSGWITAGMKSEADARLGDTVCTPGSNVAPLATFKPLQPMVYAAFFPTSSADFGALDEAIQRLMLTDRAITCSRETSAALGPGFRLGLLGALHMDVARQRLDDEYASDVIVSRPFVPVRIMHLDGTDEIIQSPVDFPAPADMAAGSDARVVAAEEAVVEARIIAPEEYAGAIMDLASLHRGKQRSLSYLAEGSDRPRVQLTIDLPLAAVVSTFYSQLKSLSSGYATLDYSEPTFQPADLVQLNILVDSVPVDALCSVVPREFAERDGREMLARLKDLLPRAQFEIVLQAAVGKRIIARERIAPFRKDVLGRGKGVTGKDRKQKVLDAQREGKKRMRSVGRVSIPSEAFYTLLSTDPSAKKEGKAKRS